MSEVRQCLLLPVQRAMKSLSNDNPLSRATRTRGSTDTVVRRNPMAHQLRLVLSHVLSRPLIGSSRRSLRCPLESSRDVLASHADAVLACSAAGGLLTGPALLPAQG